MPKASVTRQQLKLAILRIEHGRPVRVNKERARLNITTVAREAGVSAASIHNNYPDIADVIRAKANVGSQTQRAAKREALAQAQHSTQMLKQRVRALEQDLIGLASENARLTSENMQLKALVASPGVLSIRRKTQ